MKKLIYHILLLIISALCLASCRAYIDPVELIARVSGGSSTSQSGNGGNNGGNNNNPSNPSGSGTGEGQGTGEGNGGSDNPTGGSGTGSDDSGSGNQSGGNGGSSDNPTGNSPSLEKLEGYFVRPQSGTSFSLTPAEDSEIWYMFTSTASSASRPNFSMLAPKKSNNLIINNDLSSFELPKHNNLKYPDYIPAELTSEDIARASVKTKSRPKSSPSTEDKGSKIELYRTGSNGRVKVNATCKAANTVTIKDGTTRKVLIYEEDGCAQIAASNSNKNFWPSDSFDYGLPGYTNVDEWQALADYFLKDGNDNDIYDIVTTLMGNDNGVLYTLLSSSGIIPFDGTITIFFCDAYGQGNVQSGTMGYHSSGDSISGRQNDRSMIYIHGYAAGNRFMGEALTTMAHEFAHLVWEQYHSINIFNNTDFKCAYDKDNSVTEMFSGLIEGYVAHFLDEQIPIGGIGVYDPFNVVNPNNYNKSQGYLLPYSSSNPNGNYYLYCVAQGRGQYYVEKYNMMNMDKWGDEDYDGQYADEGIVEEEFYGHAASLGHYLLVNYGPNFINTYNEVTGDDLQGLKGIVVAINRMQNSNSMTVNKLLADWGTATMLSNVPTLDAPYSVNKQNWFTINGLKVPSVNYWVYTGQPYVQNNSYQLPWQGFQSSTKTNFRQNTNNMYKVKSTQQAGSTYTATAPTLPAGVTLTVLAVPKSNRNC